jgi:hypothetical protein
MDRVSSLCHLVQRDLNPPQEVLRPLRQSQASGIAEVLSEEQDTA